MKLRLDFVLENADWPALLVDDIGTIRCANQTAIAVFGSVVEGESSSLSSIWTPDNGTTPEQFIVRWVRSHPTATLLKFKIKGGATNSYLTYICPFSRDGQKAFIFQCLDPAQGTARPGSTPSSAVEAGVAQKQKLDCALQLIRTVVLDFNNALTSILGHTSLILGRIEPNHPWRHSLVEVEKSAEKAAEIAHDLAAFSRQEKDTHALAAGNLNDLLRRTVEVFQAPGSFNLSWNLQLERRLFTVYFDEAKMQQVFLKIFDNSIQAAGTEAKIQVLTRNMELTGPLKDGSATVAPGHYVCVEIKDNGCGIPTEMMPHIFEPFFTTKPNHRGLGLAWVYGIVTNHGGSVAVSSVVGQETSVRLYLPAEKRFVKDLSLKSNELEGHQTILFVDDEDLMLTMGQIVLSSFGYQVLTASSAEKALEIFTEHKDHIDLVITDLVMPKMSGRQLVEQLRRQAPHVKILCCSGYVRPTHKDEEEGYLQKPFTSQELLRKVKQVITQLDLT